MAGPQAILIEARGFIQGVVSAAMRIAGSISKVLQFPENRYIHSGTQRSLEFGMACGPANRSGSRAGARCWIPPMRTSTIPRPAVSWKNSTTSCMLGPRNHCCGWRKASGLPAKPLAGGICTVRLIHFVASVNCWPGEYLNPSHNWPAVWRAQRRCPPN